MSFFFNNFPNIPLYFQFFNNLVFYVLWNLVFIIIFLQLVLQFFPMYYKFGFHIFNYIYKFLFRQQTHVHSILVINYIFHTQQDSNPQSMVDIHLSPTCDTIKLQTLWLYHFTFVFKFKLILTKRSLLVHHLDYWKKN